MSLFAENLSFSCNKSDIPEQAKGSYRYDYYGKIFYETAMGEELDLLSLTSPDISNPNLKSNDLRVSSSTEVYGNHFYSFDDYGNLYFIVTGSFYVDLMKQSAFNEDNNIERAVFLYKFDPINKTLSNFFITYNSIPHSFCISNDGKWAFLDTLDCINVYEKQGFGTIYSFPTDLSLKPEVIYKSTELRKIESSIRNVYFDSNVNRTYFYSDNDGLYFIYADETGNFSKLGSFPKKKYSTSVEPCAVYANKEGLWGVKESSINAKNSQLFKITDNKGNLLDFSTNIIQKEIMGNWNYGHKISVQPDYILFISDNNSKIYKYENNSLKNVTKLLPHKKEYDSQDFEILSEIIYKAANENTEFKAYKTTIKILVIVCCLILTALIILIIWIINLSQKTNILKKDKKFIFNIQETERGKISRDIHDSIIQDIRAIRIETELLNVNADSENRKNKVVNIATDCVVKLRNICYNLTPAELAIHEDGDSSKIELVSIIQNLVLQFIERTHVPCQLKIDENFEYPVLDKETSQNLFRIIQESLNNIEKHSYATNCQILIKNKIVENRKCMLVYISDDGIGCDIKSITKRRGRLHFGLQNMKDRAALINAAISFQSEPGQGFEVRIEI